jgi:protein-S-isoprenylcysteine O-methyltransferase Ste14
MAALPSGTRRETTEQRARGVPGRGRHARTSRTRPDFGRLIMVPGAAVLLFFDMLALAHGTASGATGALRWLGTVLVAAFYALIIWCYLRRRPAVATCGSVTAHIAAVTGTLTPFVIPLLHGSPPGGGLQLAADLLLVAGLAWAVWSLRFLGRNVSVIAQARQVVERGPYRWVRHPLYTGEIVSALGLGLTTGSVRAVIAWLLLVALQVYRAMREEQVLLRALPGYRDYRGRTAALLPGLF